MSSRSILETIRPVALGVAALLVLPGATAGADEGLTLELNKVEEAAEGCQAFFLLNNQSGHVFDGFRLELILFDQDGVVSERLRVDMAPVRHDKRTVSTYIFPGMSCAEIGSILVNDVPVCESRDGAELDCVDLLKVSHRDAIELEK
jgi:hypothetical protein